MVWWFGISGILSVLILSDWNESNNYFETNFTLEQYRKCRETIKKQLFKVNVNFGTMR